MNWLNVHDLEGWHPSDSSFEIEDDKREIVASLNIIFTNLTRGNRAKPVALKPISMKSPSLPPPVSQYVVPRVQYGLPREIFKIDTRNACINCTTRLRRLILISPFSFTLFCCYISTKKILRLLIGCIYVNISGKKRRAKFSNLFFFP